MRLVRLLLYVLATLAGLYLLAAVLYAIPMVSGALDDTMEVKFDRPDPSIVADYCNGLTPGAEGNLLPPLARLGDHALDPADRGRRRRSWLHQAIRRESCALRPVARPGARRRVACGPDSDVQPLHVWHGLRRDHLRGLPCGRAAPRRQGRAGRRRSQHVQSAALLLGGRRCAARRR